LTDEEGDFILIHHEDLRLSQKAEEVYAQLQKMLQEQQAVSSLSASALSLSGLRG
jgi:coiled-coil and C2 domain-containing protein 1